MRFITKNWGADVAASLELNQLTSSRLREISKASAKRNYADAVALANHNVIRRLNHREWLGHGSVEKMILSTDWTKERASGKPMYRTDDPVALKKLGLMLSEDGRVVEHDDLLVRDKESEKDGSGPRDEHEESQLVRCFPV